jgi:BirA family transcriptional regulator, biotin operon repressor / biotin---[acetyl-CoA-carboxylase] ligase
MDVLHAMAGDGAAEGTAIIAEEQTEGRGSRGRTWHSPRGGLWLSVLARPSVPSGLDPMSLRAGLAVSRAVASLAPGERLRLKWPNDLMLGERKVGGILCEARWQGDTLAWVVVGLGLNVTNEVPDAVRETAANLAQRWPHLQPAALVEPVVTAIRAIDVRSARLDDSELRSFHALDWLAGRALTDPIAGVAEGVEADAALRVRQADGRLMLARTGTVALAESSFRA